MSADLRETLADGDNKQLYVQSLFFKCTSLEIEKSNDDALFQFHWYIDGRLQNSSDFIVKSNVSQGYFYEHNGMKKLGIQVHILQ